MSPSIQDADKVKCKFQIYVEGKGWSCNIHLLDNIYLDQPCYGHYERCKAKAPLVGAFVNKISEETCKWEGKFYDGDNKCEYPNKTHHPQYNAEIDLNSWFYHQNMEKKCTKSKPCWNCPSKEEQKEAETPNCPYNFKGVDGLWHCQGNSTTSKIKCSDFYIIAGKLCATYSRLHNAESIKPKEKEEKYCPYSQQNQTGEYHCNHPNNLCSQPNIKSGICNDITECIQLNDKRKGKHTFCDQEVWENGMWVCKSPKSPKSDISHIKHDGKHRCGQDSGDIMNEKCPYHPNYKSPDSKPEYIDSAEAKIYGFQCPHNYKLGEIYYCDKGESYLNLKKEGERYFIAPCEGLRYDCKVYQAEHSSKCCWEFHDSQMGHLCKMRNTYNELGYTKADFDKLDICCHSDCQNSCTAAKPCFNKAKVAAIPKPIEPKHCIHETIRGGEYWCEIYDKEKGHNGIELTKGCKCDKKCFNIKIQPNPQIKAPVQTADFLNRIEDSIKQPCSLIKDGRCLYNGDYACSVEICFQGCYCEQNCIKKMKEKEEVNPEMPKIEIKEIKCNECGYIEQYTVIPNYCRQCGSALKEVKAKEPFTLLKPELIDIPKEEIDFDQSIKEFECYNYTYLKSCRNCNHCLKTDNNWLTDGDLCIKYNKFKIEKSKEVRCKEDWANPKLIPCPNCNYLIKKQRTCPVCHTSLKPVKEIKNLSNKMETLSKIGLWIIFLSTVMCMIKAWL